MNKVMPGLSAQTWMVKILAIAWLLALLPFHASAAGLDRNGNSLNDVWELLYNAGTLPPFVDTDGDGYTNAQESAAGTNPRDALSRPALRIVPWPPELVRFSWDSFAGKRYRLLSRTDVALGGWETNATLIADGAAATLDLTTTNAFARFYRLAIDDADSDADGVTDYEERALGFNPATPRTGPAASCPRRSSWLAWPSSPRSSCSRSSCPWSRASTPSCRESRADP